MKTRKQKGGILQKFKNMIYCMRHQKHFDDVYFDGKFNGDIETYKDRCNKAWFHSKYESNLQTLRNFNHYKAQFTKPKSSKSKKSTSLKIK